MSVLNCGSITGGALGAALTKFYGVTSDDYTNLFQLVATCVVLTMAPAPFLSMLPNELDTEKPEEGEATVVAVDTAAAERPLHDSGTVVKVSAGSQPVDAEEGSTKRSS